MVKARVNPAPKPSVDIDAFIERGGSSPAAAPQKTTEADDVAKFPLRYPVSIKARIEAAIKRLPGHVSINTWLIQAATEKLERDEPK
ncbi:hypothetical protein ACIU1J_32300 [Azospirillum doebereinerae]|uniref:hypothetical protein n=1 Tax=Azospirillum doebereinerae TaxID=92933 RepID=UPI001EE5CCFE|nr:hypothetical protein [Azospirillum doebereinerae]MCG5238376.1 hypothetical protein [Azospirillum doebereinerae]